MNVTVSTSSLLHIIVDSDIFFHDSAQVAQEIREKSDRQTRMLMS